MGKATRNADGWAILRTSGPRTSALAESLIAAGFDAWTPIEVKRTRLPRGRKAMVDKAIPIAPTFVFVRAWHVAELLEICAAPRNPHPAFSVFHYGGDIPLIADTSLAGMRSREEDSRIRILKTTRRSFPINESVHTPTGAFAGLTGVVEDADSKSAMVNFGGGFRVRIASWLLEKKLLSGQASMQDIAA